MPADKDLIKSLPKVELHVHLDCSLSYSVVKLLDPSISYDAYRRNFIGPVKCLDLNDYLDRAEHALRLMQTPDNLKLVVSDLFNQFKEDGVIYAEIRFAPLLHIRGGMSSEEVVRVVSSSIKKCIRETGIEGGLIICTLRHFSLKESLITADLACQFHGAGVIGFDIASNEAGYPLDNHLEAFNRVQARGIPCTAHAGEARGAESVWETIHKIHPQRIGHGVRSERDNDLLKYLRNNDIHLEMCPTSNIQTRACSDMHLHPIDRMYHEELSLSINTDARTISDTTLAREYMILEEYFDWGIEHFFRCNLEAIKHAFTSDEIKKRITERIENTYSMLIQ